MCGICGVYRQDGLSDLDVTIFKELLFLNQLRGVDSTGVAKVDKGRSISVLKGLGDSGTFLRTEAAKQFVTKDSVLLMGHCRDATVGSIVQNNAHPFSFEHVVGAMNGTFLGTFENSNKFSTDSEAIFHNINEAIKEGKDPIEVGLQNSMVYTPKFALEFVNKKNSTLNFIRNKERPLHFTFIDNRKTLVWSSTSEILECILEEILNVPMSGWKGKDDKDEVFTLHEHDLFQVVIGKPATSATIFKKKLEPAKVSYMSGYTNPQSHYYGGMFGEEYDQWDDYFPGDNGQGTTGQGSKVLIKCEDGQYRSREAEAKRKAASTFRPPNTGASGASDNPANGGVVINYGKGAPKKKRKSATDDYSTLNWLQTVVEEDVAQLAEKRLEKFLEAAFAQTGSKSDTNRPQSSYELKYRLTEGCCCCGRVVDADDLEEVARVRWWNREAWACGNCYEFSDGDWVRCSIEDDWIPKGENPVVVH